MDSGVCLKNRVCAVPGRGTKQAGRSQERNEQRRDGMAGKEEQGL